jgi:hypothetical protein
MSKDPAEIFRGLRNVMLNLKPSALKTKPGPQDVWLLIMEMAYPEGCATLVSVADGTVSVYFSGGGGIIGLGKHDGPRQASEALLAAAPKFLSYCHDTNAFPLPHPGRTCFYLRVGEKFLTAEANTDDLGYNRHPLSPLFFKAQELLTVVRLLSAKLHKDNPNSTSA